MNYKLIEKAKFIKRPNRFLAHVDINGKEEIVHVRNTGRCKELLTEGANLILEDCKSSKTRKTRYSLISVYKDGRLINMDSQIPNMVIYNAIKNQEIPEIGLVENLKKEKTYKNSRFDIYFEKKNKKFFLEVKGVTLEKNNIAYFPDAPTTRGTKHVYELIDAVKSGYEAYILFLIQMENIKEFRLNWTMDTDFSKAVRLAHSKGVNILVYDSLVEPKSIRLGNIVPYNLEK